MALRHGFAFKALPDFRAEVEPSAPPSVMRPAHEVNFRPESDLVKIVEEITRYSRVRLSAAPGAGKSTKVPIKIAEIAKVPVLLAVPSEHLAEQHFLYLSSLSPNDYSLALDETDVVGTSGVTITSYAWLTGRILQCKGQGSKPFGDCVVFADEVHESDAYSEFVRRVISGVPGVKHLVLASATHDPARMPRLEAKGDTVTKFFAKESPHTWDPADHGKPWSITTLKGNLLIILDDDKAALELVRKYAVLGVDAYRMSSRMKRSDAKAAFAQLNNPNAGLVVMIADYSFRNGFTYDITRIIDSGLVRNVDVQDGNMKKTYRVMYEGEKYQTMARGGRTAGSSCEYYMPEDTSFKSAICSLEQVEAEAAAVLYRMYGYSAPAEVKAVARFASGKVPKDLYNALTGFVPLVMLSDDCLMDLVIPKLTVKTEAVDILDSYGLEDSPVVTTSDLFAGLNTAVPKVVSSVAATDLLAQLQELSSTSRALEHGLYYQCSAAERNGALGKVGYEAILRAVHSNPLAVTGYSPEMRNDAVHTLLREYNLFIVTEAATSRVMAQGEALSELVRTYPQEVKIWAEWLSQKCQNSKAMSMSILKAIEQLRTPAMWFTAVPADVELEEKVARELVTPLRSAVDNANVPVDSRAFFADVSGQLGFDPGPEFPGAVQPALEDVGDDKINGQIRWKTVHVAGKAMHDMWFRPYDPIRWQLDDYISAVSTMVHRKGVVVESIRKLLIDAPGVDTDRVMQAVRDGADGKRKFGGYTVVRVDTNRRITDKY